MKRIRVSLAIMLVATMLIGVYTTAFASGSVGGIVVAVVFGYAAHIVCELRPLRIARHMPTLRTDALQDDRRKHHHDGCSINIFTKPFFHIFR